MSKIDLPSLARMLGEYQEDLYLLSNQTKSFYKKVDIPKKDSGVRHLTVPSSRLKELQRTIAHLLLNDYQISQYATAYHSGSSIANNARPHISAHSILRLDIHHFFDNISYGQIRNRVFCDERFDSPAGALLTHLCTYDGHLPQGAPTSPAISNIIMYEFDEAIGSWCANSQIVYTRYCDDMTFSGKFDPTLVVSFVSNLLRQEGFSLNDKKTVFTHRGQRMGVTGIVVNEKLSVPSEYKRKIRQEIFYCRKYGIENHLHSVHSQKSPEQYLQSMQGKVQYVLSIAPTEEFLFYSEWIRQALKALQIKQQYQQALTDMKRLETVYERKRKNRV